MEQLNILKVWQKGSKVQSIELFLRVDAIGDVHGDDM